MVEFIEAFKDQINLVLGALIAYLSFVAQGRITHRQAQEKLALEKIERCYALCQAVYDGHLREVGNLEQNLEKAPAAFLAQRRHPGAEMSELKMLLKCYTNGLDHYIPALDTSHKPLKDNFRKYEALCRSGTVVSHEDVVRHVAESKVLLALLGDTTAELKDKLAMRAKTFVALH